MDEENLDAEDLESILDDCLALGMPEKHLNWHYRSKHESLIAFSNVMYYGNKLCTFPSPDALESKVRLAFVEDGVYDRGFTKRNRAEAEALVAEVVRRLKDPKLSRSSIGVVTFSTAQQDYVERRLTDALVKNKLEDPPTSARSRCSSRTSKTCRATSATSSCSPSATGPTARAGSRSTSDRSTRSAAGGA